MSGRQAFVIVAGGVLALAFLLLVVIPGVQRGGWGEVVGIIALVITVLLFERWLRSR